METFFRKADWVSNSNLAPHLSWYLEHCSTFVDIAVILDSFVIFTAIWGAKYLLIYRFFCRLFCCKFELLLMLLFLFITLSSGPNNFFPSFVSVPLVMANLLNNFNSAFLLVVMFVYNFLDFFNLELWFIILLNFHGINMVLAFFSRHKSIFDII